VVYFRNEEKLNSVRSVKMSVYSVNPRVHVVEYCFETGQFKDLKNAFNVQFPQDKVTTKSTIHI
jgi:hypothetical protein